MPLAALINSAGYGQLSMQTCVGIYACRVFTECTLREWTGPLTEVGCRGTLRERTSPVTEGGTPLMDRSLRGGTSSVTGLEHWHFPVPRVPALHSHPVRSISYCSRPRAGRSDFRVPHVKFPTEYCPKTAFYRLRVARPMFASAYQSFQARVDSMCYKIKRF